MNDNVAPWVIPHMQKFNELRFKFYNLIERWNPVVSKKRYNSVVSALAQMTEKEAQTRRMYNTLERSYKRYMTRDYKDHIAKAEYTRTILVPDSHKAYNDCVRTYVFTPKKFGFSMKVEGDIPNARQLVDDRYHQEHLRMMYRDVYKQIADDMFNQQFEQIQEYNT